MSKPFIKEHNVETGEEIEREMTDSEYADFSAGIEADNQRKAEAQAKAAARQAILDRLGLTEDEAKLLLG